MTEIMIGKTKYADDAKHLYEQACTMARGEGNPSTAKGRAAHLYKSVTGEWPSRLWDFDRVANVPISRAVKNKARSNSIAYRAGVVKKHQSMPLL